MPGNGNLRVLSSEEAREYGRKGGKASGEARRKKATLRKIAKGMIDGDKMTELVKALQEAAVDPYNNHQVAAFKELMRLLGADKSPADKREQKARIAKMEAETEALRLRINEERPEEFVDDGFMEALSGTAAEDWQDE